MTSSLLNRTLGQEEQRRPFPSLPESQLKALVRESYHFRARGRKGQWSFLALAPSTRFLCFPRNKDQTSPARGGGAGGAKGSGCLPPSSGSLLWSLCLGSSLLFPQSLPLALSVILCFSLLQAPGVQDSNSSKPITALTPALFPLGWTATSPHCSQCSQLLHWVVLALQPCFDC